jgi:hypothetical protein
MLVQVVVLVVMVEPIYVFVTEVLVEEEQEVILALAVEDNMELAKEDLVEVLVEVLAVVIKHQTYHHKVKVEEEQVYLVKDQMVQLEEAEVLEEILVDIQMEADTAVEQAAEQHVYMEDLVRLVE